MKAQSRLSTDASLRETIQPGSGLLLLVEAMADCEECRPHDEIFEKLEKILLDVITTGDQETGAALSLDPTPDQIARIREALTIN